MFRTEVNKIGNKHKEEQMIHDTNGELCQLAESKTPNQRT